MDVVKRKWSEITVVLRRLTRPQRGSYNVMAKKQIVDPNPACVTYQLMALGN